MNRIAAYTLGLILSSACAGCTGHEGVIGVSIAASPNSDLLSRIDRLEASFTTKNQTVTAYRDDDGSLSLGIDLVADGSSGDLIVEGFDSQGERIAVGRVGPLPLASIDADVVAFMAPPNSITLAPVSLGVPRSHIGSTEASFGALFAGGLGSDGPSDEVSVYSTYLHTVQNGLALPEPRSDLTLIAGSSGFFYMIGGEDEEQVARSESFTFDTSVPPSGSYRPLAILEEHARSGSSAAIVGAEQFLVSGDPALLVDGLRGTASPLESGAGLLGRAATAVSDSSLQVIFAGADVVSPDTGDTGAAVFEGNQVRHLPPPPELLRKGHRAITLLSGNVLFLGGAIEGVGLTRDAVRYAPDTGLFDVFEMLSRPRRNPAVALTSRHLAVIGGEDENGDAIGDAEIFDVHTLAPITTIPLVVPRKNAVAVAIGNGQLLVAGGQDETGAPTELLSLFTPDEEAP